MLIVISKNCLILPFNLSWSGSNPGKEVREGQNIALDTRFLVPLLAKTYPDRNALVICSWGELDDKFRPRLLLRVIERSEAADDSDAVLGGQLGLDLVGAFDSHGVGKIAATLRSLTLVDLGSKGPGLESLDWNLDGRSDTDFTWSDLGYRSNPEWPSGRRWPGPEEWFIHHGKPFLPSIGISDGTSYQKGLSKQPWARKKTLFFSFHL